jgi:hypothetical protein
MTIPAFPDLPPVSSSSLSSANFNQTARINQVFSQIVSLLGVLQSTAVVQSQNLNFLTSWQKAYTNLMSKVPVFTSASTVFGGTATSAGNVRDDVNRINSTYLEQLRSQNSILSDTAKAMQTNISQTNDLVTQFGNMATALLEEMSTILTTIYR